MRVILDDEFDVREASGIFAQPDVTGGDEAEGVRGQIVALRGGDDVGE
jgi:hypothetical protein